MRRALFAVVLATVNCSLLGSYVVTRRMAFVSTALTHSILPGVVFAVILGVSPYWGALGAALATALGVGWLAGRRELREDTAIGVVLAFMFALGVLLMSLADSFQDFSSLLFGSVFGVGAGDLWVAGGVSALILGSLVLFHRGLVLASYDEEYAAQSGFCPDGLRLLLLVLVALGTVTCVRIAGVLLTTSLLVIPAATAVLLARTFRAVMALSAALGFSGGVGGLLLSAVFERVPPGAAIVLCCCVFFFVAFAAVRLREWLVARFPARKIS